MYKVSSHFDQVLLFYRANTHIHPPKNTLILTK